MKKSKVKINLLFLLLLMVLCILNGCSSNSSSKVEIIVSAAASLQAPMEEIADSYMEENSGVNIVMNLGSSGNLRKQIEEGAKVDIFLAADNKETGKLVEEGYIKEENNKDILTNGLLLVKSNNAKEQVKSIEDLKGKDIILAIGEESAPIGRYSRDILENVNVLDELESKIVYCKDAKAILNYVKLGEVDYAIVYINETENLGDVEIVEEIDKSYHEPIIYSLGQINTLDYVKDFVEYINKNMDVFEKYNFSRKE